MENWKVEPDGSGDFNIVNGQEVVRCHIMNGPTRASKEQTAIFIANAPATLRQRDALLAACEDIVNYEDARRRTAASGRSQELPKSVVHNLAEKAIASTKGE